MAYFANGTEGLAFEEAWCVRCIHSDHREGKDFGDAGNPPCPVWMGHMMYAYELCNEAEHPGKILLDMLIKPGKDPTQMPECAMFFPRDRGQAPMGQEALEL